MQKMPVNDLLIGVTENGTVHLFNDLVEAFIPEGEFLDFLNGAIFEQPKRYEVGDITKPPFKKYFKIRD